MVRFQCIGYLCRLPPSSLDGEKKKTGKKKKKTPKKKGVDAASSIVSTDIFEPFVFVGAEEDCLDEMPAEVAATSHAASASAAAGSASAAAAAAVPEDPEEEEEEEEFRVVMVKNADGQMVKASLLETHEFHKQSKVKNQQNIIYTEYTQPKTVETPNNLLAGKPTDKASTAEKAKGTKALPGGKKKKKKKKKGKKGKKSKAKQATLEDASGEPGDSDAASDAIPGSSQDFKGRARVTEVLDSAKENLSCPDPEQVSGRQQLDIVTNRSQLPQVTSWLTDVEIIEHVSSEETLLMQHRERHGMDVTYLTRVGQLYRYLNDLPKAVVCFWGALLKDPLAKDALLSMSDLTFNLRYWKDAEYIVRQIFQLPGGGDVAQNHYVFGQALFAQNKVSEANQAFRRSLSLQPDLKPAQIALESSRHVARMIYTPDYENTTAAVIAACMLGTISALYFFTLDRSDSGVKKRRPPQQPPGFRGQRFGKGATFPHAYDDEPSKGVKVIKRILLVASLMAGAATLVLLTGFAKRQRGDDAGLYPSHPATSMP